MKSKLFVIVTQHASALNPSHEQGAAQTPGELGVETVTKIVRQTVHYVELSVRF